MDEENQLENAQEVEELNTPDSSEAGVVSEAEVLDAEVSSEGSEPSETESDVAEVDATVASEAEAAVMDEPAAEQSANDTADTAVIAALSQEIESLKSQLEERTGQYMRIAADFDNFRRRTQKERQDLEAQAKCSTIIELLPVVDNFERARSQIKPQTEPEMTIHKSYQSVYKQLVECLKRIGVAPMRAEGQEFDPNLHEAVMRQPTDEYEEGVVIEELVRGYVLGERVLRHAMVKVATAPEPGSEPEPDSSDSDVNSAME